jgi:signal transduction histidine kinase
MQKYAEDFLGAANIGCRFSFPIEVPAWPLSAEARHNLFLAFKEVLNNTVKHASATEVSIQLAVQSDAFVLRIKDNGRGFDHARSQPSDSGQIISGNGLANLEQRLASISGRCEINTARGQGTEVVFVAKMSGSAILPGAPPIPH